MVNIWEKQHWQQFHPKKPIPQYFYGTLEDVQIAPETRRIYEFVSRCQYHVSLEKDFGESEPIGVKERG